MTRGRRRGRRALRLLALTVVAAGLAPGTWLRSPLPAVNDSHVVTVTALERGAVRMGPDLVQSGAWALTSPNSNFGGYSALLAFPGGRLMAISDSGRYMRFTLGAPVAPLFGTVAERTRTGKAGVDIEAATRDPATGTIWFAYEGLNAIERRDERLGNPRRVRPAAMREWGVNSGPEAFTRLADGRFLALSEGPSQWFGGLHEGIVFNGDPVAAPEISAFRFAPPDGYRPVDMVQLPDGRVLILVRRVVWDAPPRFEAKLVLADISDLQPNAIWAGEEMAHFAPPLPSENYEGLAVVPVTEAPGGPLDLWLIADDNFATFQRTLLLRLRWTPPAP